MIPDLNLLEGANPCLQMFGSSFIEIPESGTCFKKGLSFRLSSVI
jgi:hypothetical protein